VSTLQQALKILEDPNRSEELVALAEKWRGAARLAADAVFAGARDKVNRMGGVGAWREKERERIEWQRSWDDAEQKIDVSCTGQDMDESDNYADEMSVNPEESFWRNVRDDDVCFCTFFSH
jgi:hypothetical protein